MHDVHVMMHRFGWVHGDERWYDGKRVHTGCVTGEQLENYKYFSQLRQSLFKKKI